VLSDSIWLWVGFNAVVLGMLALDLGVFHRHAHRVSTKEAAIWSTIWISLALLFNLWIFYAMGAQKGVEFTTGYLVEKSLSVDNVFLFLIIFQTFQVPAAYQHRVLFWGVLGALVMRGAMIAAGAVLLERFHWVAYVFGGFLVFTGVRMALLRNQEPHPERNPVLRLARRVLPVTEDYVEDKFFVRRAGKLLVTPLFLVLILVETTDLMFAVDSIPAIFAITSDPFIVYTSNVFALLGLRSLFFLLGGALEKFHYLKLGLSVVLVFVGIKLVIADFYKMPALVSLLIIAAILVAAGAASYLRARRISTGRHVAADALPGKHP
jgi:tellurite resistance protein TerC